MCVYLCLAIILFIYAVVCGFSTYLRVCVATLAAPRPDGSGGGGSEDERRLKLIPGSGEVLMVTTR